MALAIRAPGDRGRLSRAGDGHELAEPFAITKQAVSKHIQVLERAGLVTRSRDARDAQCT